MNLIDEIKETLSLEIRPNSVGSEYLEAVIGRQDLPLLLSLLENAMGRAVKEPGQEVVLPEQIQAWVDRIGGLRIEQSFFFKQDDQKVTYAALWPWQSNPDKITLKCGEG